MSEGPPSKKMLYRSLQSSEEKITFLEDLIHRLSEGAGEKMDARTASTMNTALELMAKLQGQMRREPEKKEQEEQVEVDWRKYVVDLSEADKTAVAKVFNRISDDQKRPRGK